MAVLVFLTSPPVFTAEALDFDETFGVRSDDRQTSQAGRTSRSDPASRFGQSYYAATYRLAGREHHLEVWRDREVRVKRRTDDAIETYVVRRAGDVEWKMTVLDLRRKIRTDVARTNLMRIGHFTDWFAQAHSLSRPRGAYRLTAVDGGVAAIKPIAACRWYLLSQAERATKICWSSTQRVPLVITGADDEVVWRVTKLVSGPVDSKVFAIDDRGFVRNDANEDIQAD